MTAFFETLRKSVYDPAWYRSLVHSVKPGPAFGYAAILLLLSALVQGVLFGFMLTRGFGDLPARFTQVVQQSYPQDLVVTIKDGHASMNKEESVHVGDSLVVAANEPYWLQAQRASGVAIWMASDGIGVMQKQGEYRFFTYEEFEMKDLVIDRAFVNETAAKVAPYLAWVRPIVMVGMFVGLLLLSALVFAWNLLGACIVWVIGAMKGINLTYGKAYLIGLYALTPTVLIDVAGTALNAAGARLHEPPLLGTLVFTVFIALNLSRHKPEAYAGK